MEIPKGWGKDGKDADSGYVFQLNKTVYGLPQASNAAQKELRGAFSVQDDFCSTSGVIACMYLQIGASQSVVILPKDIVYPALMWMTLLLLVILWDWKR